MKISLIVPVFNEEDNINIFYNAVSSNLLFETYELEVIFINDGSVDNTLNIIESVISNDSRVTCINLFRNFGKEAALLAGLHASTGDLIIPIDVDLQDPIEVIPKLVKKWETTKADTVLAKRMDRSSDTYLKRTTAKWFYRIHNKISKNKIIENVGDFRLITREVLEILLQMPEKNLFMKGLLSWPCGKIEIIEYKREARVLGHTKFNGKKLWELAIEGITSFSTFPLKVWSYIGISISFAAFIYGSILIIRKLFFKIELDGYASLMVSILFLGGCQLVGIGILGEYIGRIFIEIKSRPRYIIRK